MFSIYWLVPNWNRLSHALTLLWRIKIENHENWRQQINHCSCSCSCLWGTWILTLQGAPSGTWKTTMVTWETCWHLKTIFHIMGEIWQRWWLWRSFRDCSHIISVAGEGVQQIMVRMIMMNSRIFHWFLWCCLLICNFDEYLQFVLSTTTVYWMNSVTWGSNCLKSDLQRWIGASDWQTAIFGGFWSLE